MTEIQNIRKVALLALLLCFMAVVGRAQDKKDMFNPVNASVTSQTIAPDARAAGMGDVGAATEADVNSQYFKGGEASLKLTNPDNVLETGVEIFACPPGKSLKTITLLSGGEKTLTAISLLFAILNIRTVPFCIFDEVEAALDENNVDVFGHYLGKYRDTTQFLLITHKKRTMEYAKTLYGITMQESGVSKLVSVKLED